MFKELFKKNHLTKTLGTFVLLLFSLGMGIYFHWEIPNLVFFMLFVILLISPIPSRFPALGAIIALIATAILLVLKKEDLAETSAIWAYYLMIFTAAMAFYELPVREDDAIINEN
jgi:hypothetical protein